MGASVSQSYKTRQEISNNILQKSNENCINSCKNFTEDEIVDIENTTIKGDINASQTCAVIGNTCTLKNTVDNTIANSLVAQSKQSETSAGGMWTMDFSDYDETIDIQSSIRNNISQILNSQCQSTSNNSEVRPTIYLVNDTVGGSVLLNQIGNVSKSNCMLTNVASDTVNNSETAKGDQAFACCPCPFSFSSGLFAILLFVMVGLIIAAFIVFYFMKSNKKQN